MKKTLLKFYVFFIALKDYIFREWLMYFPVHSIRNIFISYTIHALGENSSFLMGVEIRNGKNISVGNNSVINARVLLDGRGGKLKIGNNVDIAQETNIWTLEHDLNDDYHSEKGGDVTIEDYVWIASRVTILPGLTIGKGSVIATGSVVTKTIPPMSVAGGVPARIIGNRYSGLKYNLKYKPWFR